MVGYFVTTNWFLNLCLRYTHAHGTLPEERRRCKPIKWTVHPRFTSL